MTDDRVSAADDARDDVPEVPPTPSGDGELPEAPAMPLEDDLSESPSSSDEGVPLEASDESTPLAGDDGATVAPHAGGNPGESEPGDDADETERQKRKRRVKAVKRLKSRTQDDELVHSSQLDERLRAGDVGVTPRDRQFKSLMETAILVAFAALILVIVGKVGIGFRLGVAGQTYLLALATGILVSASYLFANIRWRAVRAAQGSKILDKAKGDLQLTMVSILALFTVAFMTVIEILAFLVFVGAINTGEAGARFAGNFVLFQTIILLVYMMALVARIQHASSYRPGPRWDLAAKILTPAALVFVLFGVLLATGGPQRVGILSGVAVRQSVYVVTLGVLLEFVAVRIRLRLPSVFSLFQGAVETAKRANPEMKEALQKRAMRTYLISLFFVAGSMAFAGAIATGSLAVGGTRATVSLVVFYVGTALVMLGLVAVRIFQSNYIQDRKGDEGDDLTRLVGQKRRSPQEIFRMAVYGVTGLVAAICLVLAVMTFAGRLGLHEKYGTDLFLLALLFAAGPYGFFFNQHLKRIEAMDEKFPDFLRDLAESARAGMTLPRALVTAAQGTYGALTNEIRVMAAQVEWGVDFGSALKRFAKRVDTPLIDRTVSLVTEAQRAGGNVVDILTAASEDAREIKQIISERNTQMKVYSLIIFIAFFVFITVVLILSAQFIPAFKEAVGAAEGQQVGGLQFKSFDPEDFNTLFFHAAVIQAIGGGLVGGVMTRGHPVAGFTQIAVMIVASWFCFRILVGTL